VTAEAPQKPAAEELNIRGLLQEMIQKKASDLHLTVGERPKLRIDGDLQNAATDKVLTPKDTLSLAYSILTEQQKKRFETDDELDFSFGVQNLSRFRGNCYKQRGCIAMALRYAPCHGYIGIHATAPRGYSKSVGTTPTIS
jgi:twitching motility protein PilT